jgi:hypothetical protein
LACGFDVDAEQQGSRGWLFTVSLPSHAMIAILVHAIPGIRPLAKKTGEARTPGIAWTRKPMIAPKG